MTARTLKRVAEAAELIRYAQFKLNPPVALTRPDGTILQANYVDLFGERIGFVGNNDWFPIVNFADCRVSPPQF